MTANPTLQEVVGAAREIARGVTARASEEVDRLPRWPEESLRALQQAGLGGLVVPGEAGGLGFGLLGLVRVCEELGRVCGSSAICFGMHSVGAAVIAAKATERQKDELLRPIAEGRHLTTLGLSEPGTGAHFYLPQATLKRVSEADFEVSGTKSFITNGGYSDSMVISVVAEDPDAVPGSFSCLVAKTRAPGVEWVERDWGGLGMRGNSARSAELRQVRVPAVNLLGREGDETWYVFNVIAPYFLMAMAGTYLGIAAAGVDEVRTQLGQRLYSHTGGALGEVGILQHRLGTIWAQVERTRQFIYAAATQGDAGDESALPALLSAKAEVADCAVEVLNEAMTLAGGRGYRDNGLLARLLRDARAAHVMSPTTDILRTWTGRALLNLPLLGD